MTATSRRPPEPPVASSYGDAETEAASGLSLPSLRALQAAGAIRAKKEPKNHGGFRRSWTEPDILKATIGAAISEHFAWNIRITGEALAKTRAGTWDALIAISVADVDRSTSNRASVITASEHDWFLELIDRKFLFLRVSEAATTILPDVGFRQTDLPLGFTTSKDTFQMLPWSLGTKVGRAQVQKLMGEAAMEPILLTYKLAMAAHGNFMSKATINVSMQVRAAWRRLHGLEARFVQDFHQLPLTRE
ncbi:MAG: hypothetical protein AB7I59_29350 [Geminicoccaceae bacterium]